MRSLSLAWMNRIASALDVDPQLLVGAESDNPTAIVARLLATGPEALSRPMEAVFPLAPDGDTPVVVVSVEASVGEYRSGDQVWLRQYASTDFARALNRDVLAPRPAGRFAFGRLIDSEDGRVTILPPGIGQRQVVIDQPAWIGVAEMLVRRL